MPVLFVNLKRAQERRRNVEAEIARHLPSHPIHRIEAVDGAAVSDQPEILERVSPYARLLLRQPQRASAHAQIETWGAVGCSLSHVRCWEWLLQQPAPLCREALVLEDDACFNATRFPPLWAERMGALCAPPPADRAWDLVMLGHFGVTESRPIEIHGQPLHTLGPGGSFFGTHGYVVTRRGAAILRQYAFPLEVQVDAYIVNLQQLGILRVYLFDVSEVVKQCLGSREVGIQHTFRPPTNETLFRSIVSVITGRSTSRTAPVCTASLVVWTLLLLVGFAWLARWRWSRTTATER